MKKILIFGFTENIGGLETFFINYYRHLNLEKYHIDFICAFKKMAFEEEVKKNGSQIFYVNNFFRKPLNYFYEINKIIKREKYDIIHVNMLSAANIMPILAAKLNKVKNIIVHSHCNGMPPIFLKKILNTINKKILKNRKDLIYLACSEDAGKWMFGNHAKFEIINNAIDIDRFKFDEQNRKIIRDKYNIADSDYLIGHVGRFHPTKNQEFLINVIDKISDNRIKLMLIGDGETKKSINEMINKLNLKNRVFIIDNTKDVNKFYSAFDLFVFPSLFEGLGIVALEAQVNGLNCIFSENILQDVNINSGNTYVSLNNIEKWCNTIMNFSNNKHREFNLKKFSNNGYNIENEIEKLEEIYDKER